MRHASDKHVSFTLIYVCYLLFFYTLLVGFSTLSSTMFLAMECWVTGIFIKQGWWSETFLDGWQQGAQSWVAMPKTPSSDRPSGVEAP